MGEDSTADERASRGFGAQTEDISDTPAPSVGPNTVIEREPPEERLAKHEQSKVDAMGLDKRREVVGGSYGPSFARQATLYGAVLVVLAALVIGFVILAGELDKSPEKIEEKAPWANPDARQVEPSPLQ
jgi:hypothetical protein